LAINSANSHRTKKKFLISQKKIKNEKMQAREIHSRIKRQQEKFRLHSEIGTKKYYERSLTMNSKKNRRNWLPTCVRVFTASSHFFSFFVPFFSWISEFFWIPPWIFFDSQLKTSKSIRIIKLNERCLINS